MNNIIKKAAGGIYTFFGGLNTKTILILLGILLLFLGSLWLRHHWVSEGGKQVTDSYNQRAQQEVTKQEKNNERNAQDAIEKEKDLSSNIATLQASKEALENELAAIRNVNKNPSSVVTNETHKNGTSVCKETLSPASSDKPVISSERMHNLQATIDKANQ